MPPLISPGLVLAGTLTAAGKGAYIQGHTRAGKSALLIASEGGSLVPLLAPDWHGYVRDLAAPSGPLSPYLVRQIESLWRASELTVERVQLPHAAVTADSGFSMTWDRGRHHFEIEVFPDGRYDWFYMDRDSSLRAGEEDRSIVMPSENMREYFKKIMMA